MSDAHKLSQSVKRKRKIKERNLIVDRSPGTRERIDPELDGILHIRHWGAQFSKVIGGGTKESVSASKFGVLSRS